VGPVKANGILIAIVALLGGLAAMAALFFAFDAPREPETTPAVEPPEVPAETPGDDEALFTLFIRNVPAPFLEPRSGEVVGYIFLDVAIEVGGEQARVRAEDNLDALSASFSLALASAGAGRVDAPGLPDFDRMAGMFQAEADQALGAGTARRVTITPSGADGEGLPEA